MILREKKITSGELFGVRKNTFPNVRLLWFVLPDTTLSNHRSSSPTWL